MCGKTLFIGAVPILTALLLALSLPTWDAPIAWMMFGFSTGVMLIFLGVYRAYDDYRAKLWFSRKIQNSADRWFPYLNPHRAKHIHSNGHVSHL